MNTNVRNRLKFAKIAKGKTFCVRKCKKVGYLEFDHSGTLRPKWISTMHAFELVFDSLLVGSQLNDIGNVYCICPFFFEIRL